MISFNTDNLRKLRLEKGLSKVDLEIELGMGRGHICTLESKEGNNPRVATTYKLARYFNVPMETFIKEK